MLKCEWGGKDIKKYNTYLIFEGQFNPSFRRPDYNYHSLGRC